MHAWLTNLPVDAWLKHLAAFGWRAAGALLVLLVGLWVAARLANLARRALGRGDVDRTMTDFLRNAVYAVLVALVVVMALQRLGVPTASLFAVLGAAGLAIGLALKDSLSNLAWGVLLVALRPYRAGDFVEAGGSAGTVERIGLMQTWLVTADNREAIVPNALAGGAVILNYNRRGTRRFEVKVGIGYEADIGRAVTAAGELFAADKRILTEPAPGVWLEGLGESSVNLVLRGWTRSADIADTQSDFTRALKERFDAEHISLPFPQREIRIVNGTPA